jgi:hypothetical protein
VAIDDMAAKCRMTWHHMSDDVAAMWQMMWWWWHHTVSFVSRPNSNGPRPNISQPKLFSNIYTPYIIQPNWPKF